jgi:uncharacterized protein YqgC (DUF456 family)
VDFTLFILGLICVIVGIFGSFLPILPGPPISWLGLLFLLLTNIVPQDWWFLGITLGIAIFVFAMDYIIPAVGTKKFGGTKAGMIGTTVGLIVGLIAPIPGGIIIGPFLGAFVGELINKADNKTAFKAAFGSFLGFLTGTFMKFVVGIVYFGLFISKSWEYKHALFSFLY